MLLIATAIPAYAQSDDELPTRVGRIAESSGDIFLAPEDRANEWIPVGVNYPVTTGDNLWVGGDGRAEVDYGGGQFRLGGDTNLNVSRLDERQLALFIAQGRLAVRVRSLGAGESARIDTPNAQLQLMRPGLYRIDVPPDRAMTTVSVREGEAQVTYAGGVLQALPGQSVYLAGAEPSPEVRNAIARDAFDAWSGNRDRYYEGGTAAEYVSPEMVGYAELDHFGSWESYPEYGSVWFPAGVAPGWAPYSDGYWTNVGGFGNTWVDAAPWGYAPFHYGRWVWFGRRWGWCPGRVPAHPAWAPALVAWYGGTDWGASLGNGGPVYGWVPLGWREPYRPSWRGCGERCWNRYNRPYAVVVPYAQRRTGPEQSHVNANVPGAISAVPGATFAQRKPVAPNRIALPPRAVSAAPLLADAPSMRMGPTDIAAARPGARALPAPASTLRPASPAGRMGVAPGALPARAQTGVPPQPQDSRARIPANPAVPIAPAHAGNGVPVSPGRAAVVPAPVVPSRDAGANPNAPAVLPDGRLTTRTEPVRSVPAPQAQPGVNAGVPIPPARSVPVPQSSSGAGVPMPASRIEPARSVPVPRSLPAPSAAAPVLPPRAVAPQAPRQVQTPPPQPQGVVPAQAEGRAAPAQHAKETKEAPAPAGTSVTPGAPK